MEHNGKRKQPGGQVTWGQSRSPGSSCFQLVIPELREYFPNIPNVPSPYVCGLSTMLMAWPGAVLRPYFPLLGSFHASEITLLSLDICVPLPPALSTLPFTPSGYSPFSTLLLNILSFLSLSGCSWSPCSPSQSCLSRHVYHLRHWNVPPILRHIVLLSHCSLSWGHGGEKPDIQTFLSILRLGMDSEIMSLCLSGAGLAKLTLSQLSHPT